MEKLNNKSLSIITGSFGPSTVGKIWFNVAFSAIKHRKDIMRGFNDGYNHGR